MNSEMGRQRGNKIYQYGRQDRQGDKAPNWKGGETKEPTGYIKILAPEHPKADHHGRVTRARLVLETKLGRYLKEGYIPHHINGIKDDDHPENLEEILEGEHMRFHMKLHPQKRNELGQFCEA